MRNINVCPGTLISGYDTYSPTCLRKVFDGKKVSHIMDFSYKDSPEFLISSINRISISGVQEKLFSTEQPKVYELIENSFLDDKVKRMYRQSYIESNFTFTSFTG